MNMRISILNSHYSPEEVGGAERSVRWLAESLTQDGHDVTIICLGRARTSEILGGVKVERIALRNIYYPTAAGSPSALTKLFWHGRDTFNAGMAAEVGRLLHDIQPDVLHTNTLSGFSTAVWSVAKAQRIPIVHTLRDYYLLCPNTAMYRQGGPCNGRCHACRVFSWPRQRLTANVQCAVGVSGYILERHLSEGCFPNAQRRVISNGYRAAVAPTDPPVGQGVQFGFLGRLVPAKGLEMLIDAILELWYGGHPVRLIVAGAGSERYVSSLRARCGSVPVQFLGHIPPADFFRQVHFTVIPSQWNEPFARVVIESYAHGVPVIASDAGGIPEVFKGPATGMLFSSDSASDLLRCLRDAMNIGSGDHYRRLRTHSLEAAKTFVPERTAREYYETYLAVLRDRHERAVAIGG